MNGKMIRYTIGNLLKLEAALLLFPLLVSLIYHDGCWYGFLFPSIGLLALGFLCAWKKPKKSTIYAREGFIIVGLSWLLLSLFGALPFVITKQIPNFIDAFFETVSGLSTTGASILSGEQIEALSKSMLFWRSFTHWIGGMGVLVFILAILPRSEGQNIFLLKAESTGPQVGKLVSKIQFTARILYTIYFALTILEMIFLICGGMPIFDSIVNSFATAGTGGFAILSSSIGGYNSVYSEMVIAIFMFLFGINFNIFFLLLIGKLKTVLKSEELRWYVGLIVVSMFAIAINLLNTQIPGKEINYTFGVALKDSFFQVSSIMTSTGFSSVDFGQWPAFSQTILFVLMFIGACAGSTGGGIKVSRIAILLKTIKREIRRVIHPNEVKQVHFEETALPENVVQGVSSYFGLIFVIFAVSLICISFDGFDFTTNVTAIAACINNTGPGLSLVGPAGSYGMFSPFSKLVLIASMLIGRLEIYPFLVLFLPSAWKNH